MFSIPHTSGIYKITCVPTGKIYIGSAVSLRKRCGQHRTDLRAGTHQNSYLQHAWNKYGEGAFTFEVVELVLETFRLEREQYWLDKLKVCDRSKGFNITPTAGSLLGYKRRTPRPPMSEETKQKLSKAFKGRKRDPSLPKAVSPMRGQVLSAEHRQKIGEANKGRVKTQEQIDKHRETYHVNRANHNIRKRRWRLVSPDGEEFLVNGLPGFCREHGLHAASLQAVACGKRKHSHGWTCHYADELKQ